MLSVEQIAMHGMMYIYILNTTCVSGFDLSELCNILQSQILECTYTRNEFIVININF